MFHKVNYLVDGAGYCRQEIKTLPISVYKNVSLASLFFLYFWKNNVFIFSQKSIECLPDLQTLEKV